MFERNEKNEPAQSTDNPSLSDLPEAESGPVLLAYCLNPEPNMPIIAAPSSRAWMAATTERFAHRCLPLLIANQNGWLILNSHAFSATWNGEDNVESLSIKYLNGEVPYPAMSHFGHGILTWTLPYLFRTPPGYNLLVRGPSNWPKDGAYPLEGIVETDWAVATFTMNWILTRPGLTITFDVSEPICMIVPQRRAELEAFHPEIHRISAHPELQSAYHHWLRSRMQFLMKLSMPKPTAGKNVWQKHYFHGTSPSGHYAHEHRQKLKLRPFNYHVSKEVALSSALPSGRTPVETVVTSLYKPNQSYSRRISMPYEAFGSQDLDNINRVLRHYPEIVEVIRILHMVSEKTTFPIQTFDALVDAFGGDNATILFQGQILRLGALRSTIPAYYFPISSEDDLITKLADLQATGFPTTPASLVDEPIQWGQQVDAPPPDAAPPEAIVGNLTQRPGVPKAVGIKKAE